MNMLKLSLSDFIRHVADFCAEDTTADPGGWTADNKIWGHCALVAVLTQELYGGDIWRASLLHIPLLAHVRSHYGNWLPERALLDLTAAQFVPEYPALLKLEPSSREHILSNPATLARYKIFHERYVLFAIRFSLRNTRYDENKRREHCTSVPRKKK